MSGGAGYAASAPPLPLTSVASCMYSVREACQYGAKCYRKNHEHLRTFVHPGDKNYRRGLVKFAKGHQPEFLTLWQLFCYFDPGESGYLSPEDFMHAHPRVAALAPGRVPKSVSKTWEAVGGLEHGYINFRQFATWATSKAIELDLPLGLEATVNERPCQFIEVTNSPEPDSCGCPGFQAAAENPLLCECGHKRSMHRADVSVSKFVDDSRRAHWTAGGGRGVARIRDEAVLRRIQEMMSATHKPTDNWTRDRGCRLHGVNGCSLKCALKNANPVPKSFRVVAAWRVQNMDLWQKYAFLRSSITEESSRPSKTRVKLEPKSVETSRFEVEAEPPNASCNEWFLFHGTSPSAAVAICSTNFRLAMAGCGATWKAAGESKGTPLYGYGLYFAERVTKADEYADKIRPDSHKLLANLLQERGAAGPAGLGELPELYTMLICRVVGGRTNVCTTNEIDTEKLRSDVFDGPYHSVFGDRVESLGKPYKEIVVYDKDQVYPEFLVVYSRGY
eukprot:TRINITY_DN12250_c0_g1_i1.p1 TRINITY_DN12250_c0_g1~~TRINITY_DN12250_c0_g1_i1.p1  ORF type:complete len:505 (+),score=93.19 TRINITY_DN12250_c0_g1_i1:64-1578(+)